MLVQMRYFQDVPIRYEFPQLVQGADDIGAAMRTMNTKLADLDTSLRTKLALWDGGAFGTYAQTKATWDTAASNIQELLGSISRAVHAASERMAATEMANLTRLSR